jgi:hypothetical protein
MKRNFRDMKKVKIYILVAVLMPMFIITGCELAGLDLQEKYEYDENAGKRSNVLNKTVWEFLNARSDIFSLMVEGIHYAELTEEYNKPNSTYMALTNEALGVYFLRYRFVNPNWIKGDPTTGDSLLLPAVTLTQYPKEQVRELLLYHIVKGAYSWHNLPPVQTWYDTYASADTAKVSLYLAKNGREPTIGFNNFPGHYFPEVLTATSTNLKSTSGSFVHAMDAFLDYPTRQALEDN